MGVCRQKLLVPRFHQCKTKGLLVLDFWSLSKLTQSLHVGARAALRARQPRVSGQCPVDSGVLCFPAAPSTAVPTEEELSWTRVAPERPVLIGLPVSVFCGRTDLLAPSGDAVSAASRPSCAPEGCRGAGQDSLLVQSRGPGRLRVSPA